MKPLITLLCISTMLLASATQVNAQGGGLTPPGSPGPTMRSLQEIWNKISDLESQNTTLQSQVTALQTQNTSLTNLLVTLGQNSSALTWQSTAVPASNGTSLKFTPVGQPAIACIDNANHLAYALYNGTSWIVSTVDAATTASARGSLGFNGNGQPVISYAGGGALKVATFSGTSWVSSTVEVVSLVSHALAINPVTGQPAVAYATSTSGNSDLKFAEFDGSVWSIVTVDAVGSRGDNCSLAFSSAGQPAISYRDINNTDLRFAMRQVNGTWINMAVDAGTGDIGRESSLAFAPSAQPAIAYTVFSDSTLDNNGFPVIDTTGNLRYALFDGTTWSVFHVDDSANVGSGVSLAFSPGGHPAMSYYDITNGDLRFASSNGSYWTLALADSFGNVGTGSSLAFGPDGQPAISYTGDNGVKFTARKPFATP